jgi:hypothetical protein
MKRDAERERQRNQRRIVIDLNMVDDATIRGDFLPRALANGALFLFPSFVLEELVGDGDNWPSTLHLHAKALLPLLPYVEWSREAGIVAAEEVASCRPSPILIDENASERLRELLSHASCSENAAREAFAFAPEAQRETNTRRNAEYFAKLFTIDEGNRAAVESESWERILRRDYSELVPGAVWRAARQMIQRVPQFLDAPLWKQRDFVGRRNVHQRRVRA